MTHDRGTQVVPYSARLAGAHAEFAQRMWPDKPRRGDERFLRWKYRGAGSGDLVDLLLALRGGRVVAQLGLLPIRMRSPAAPLEVRWACDLMVDPRNRRQGLGRLLYEHAQGRGLPILAANASPGGRATMLRVGFQTLPGPSVTRLPLDLGERLRWRTQDTIPLVARMLAVLGRPLAPRSLRRLLTGPEALVAERGGWREVAPLVQEREKRLSIPHIAHDEAFLAWRCAGLPGHLPAMSGAWTGAGAYALWDTHPAGTVHLRDWFAPTDEDGIALLRAVVKAGLEAGCRTIRTYRQNGSTSEDGATNWLREGGFLEPGAPLELLYYSVPLVRKGGPFRFTMYDSDFNL